MRWKATEFTLTEDHVKLLRSMYVGWQDCETGAPEIDPKRPYGNSFVAGDIMEILGWKREDECTPPEYEALQDKAMNLHRETEAALQIVLQLGTFEPGKYVRANGGWNLWKEADN